MPYPETGKKMHLKILSHFCTVLCTEDRIFNSTIFVMWYYFLTVPCHNIHLKAAV